MAQVQFFEFCCCSFLFVVVVLLIFLLTRGKTKVLVLSVLCLLFITRVWGKRE